MIWADIYTQHFSGERNDGNFLVGGKKGHGGGQ